ncbi:hypothetical protein D7030_08385 [Flavobacteriaceae bacterium AU392]|nr:hypothetical protein D1817_00030 [Flavobacteriaceae bacterium]RKM85136.1 hypothetical protein D7030_08385 [Flavobacteriaceae bacterium AU392]
MSILKEFKPTLSFSLLIALGLLISCKKSSTTTGLDEYKFFSLEQQGWKSKRVNQYINDINYTATLVPLQYYLLKSTKGDYHKTDSLYSLSNKERIVEIEFQHIKESDLLLSEFTKKSYENAVKYMAFSIEKDFSVVTSSNDTIQCSGVSFERNFKLAPFKRLLLYFNNVDPNETIKLIYQDQLFGNGIIKFNFNEIPLKL